MLPVQGNDGWRAQSPAREADPDFFHGKPFVFFFE